MFADVSVPSAIMSKYPLIRSWFLPRDSLLTSSRATPASLLMAAAWPLPAPVFDVKIRCEPANKADPSPSKAVPTMYLVPVMVPALSPKSLTRVIFWLAWRAWIFLKCIFLASTSEPANTMFDIRVNKAPLPFQSTLPKVSLEARFSFVVKMILPDLASNLTVMLASTVTPLTGLNS